MSANLIDPAPHAFIINSSDTAVFRATALLLLGVAATTAVLHMVTIGGEEIVLTFSQTGLPATPSIWLPIQTQKVLVASGNNPTTGIATIVGLYH